MALYLPDDLSPEITLNDFNPLSTVFILPLFRMLYWISFAIVIYMYNAKLSGIQILIVTCIMNANVGLFVCLLGTLSCIN